MHGFYLEVGVLHLGAHGQQLCETQRVLATRQSNEHAVAVVDETEVFHGPVELSEQQAFQLLYGRYCHLFRA